MDFLTPTLPWIKALQTQFWLIGPMKAFTFLGNEEFFLLLLPILYWLVDHRLGARIGVLLLISVCLNGVFKLFFHLPRPYWSGQVEGWATETTFGFPSGHAQNALLLWPFLALHARQHRKTWLAASLVLVVLISFSRVFLGAHYPLDILGGWTLGALLLWGALKLPDRIATRRIKVGTRAQFTATLIFSLLIAGGHWFAYNGISPDMEANRAWKVALGEAFTGRNIVAFIGAFNGLVWGLALGVKWRGRRGIAPLAGRFALGFAGLAFFYFGLKKIAPDGLLFQFARYFLTAFWIVYLAPLLFLKCRFALIETVGAPDETRAQRSLQ